jgi:hypothetical protein
MHEISGLSKRAKVAAILKVADCGLLTAEKEGL